MDTGNAAVPALAAAAADLESGGGAATVAAWPYAADPRLEEKQPLTWLRAAPFLAVILLGAALFAAGVLVVCTGPGPGAGPPRERQGRGRDRGLRHRAGARARGHVRGLHRCMLRAGPSATLHGSGWMMTMIN